MTRLREAVSSLPRVAVVTTAALVAGLLALGLTAAVPALAGRSNQGEEATALRRSGAAPSPSLRSTPAESRTASTTSSVTARDARPKAAAASGPRVEAPVRLTIPAIGADLPVRPMGVDERGFMDLPDSPRVAGWYRFGSAPSAPAGATVLAAHVDTRREGDGPLSRLDRLDPGDVVEVMAGQQRHRYRVVTVQRLGKSEVDLDELFSRSGQARLHLVTCGGEFDAEARRYQDNVIAVAAWIAST